MGTFMKASDAISGKEGNLVAIIDGNRRIVAECKNISATITKNKSEFKAIGYRGTQHKATGWSGTGSMTVYYANSEWAQMMIDYAKNGKDQYFTLQITNEDPTSGLEKQTIILMDVNLDDAEIAKLDADAEFLEESLNFTFSGVDIQEKFKSLDS